MKQVVPSSALSLQKASPKLQLRLQDCSSSSTLTLSATERASFNDRALGNADPEPLPLLGLHWQDRHTFLLRCRSLADGHMCLQDCSSSCLALKSSATERASSSNWADSQADPEPLPVLGLS